MTDRRHRYLVVAFVVAAAVVFAWWTTGSYVRLTLTPLPGEAAVDDQLSYLRLVRALVHASAWSVVFLAAVTVFVPLPARLLWKVQAGWAATVVIAHIVALDIGSRRLAAIEEPDRMFTFIKAFDAPFADVGNLYYLAWLTGVGVLAAVLTRAGDRPGAPFSASR